MRQIRNGVFETNSSSCHSLVIKKKDDYYTDEELRKHLWLYDDGVWNIRHDEDLHFGRHPFKCLATFEAKARYTIASMCCWNHDKFEEIENLIKEIIPECTCIKLPKVSYWKSDSKETYYGYVDENILTPFLEHENVSLKEFLTNKKYVVIVDGDEYCIWEDMKEAGVVNMAEIEREWY